MDTSLGGLGEEMGWDHRQGACAAGKRRRDEFGGGFALGLGVGGGGWFVFEDVGEAGGCEGCCFGLNDFDACLRDALECIDCLLEGFGFENIGELSEGKVVDLTHLECGEGRVDEVFQESVGKRGRGREGPFHPRGRGHLPRKPEEGGRGGLD